MIPLRQTSHLQRKLGRLLAKSGVLLGGLLTCGSAIAGIPQRDGPALGDARSNRLLSPEANEVAVDEMLGGELDMDLRFIDHHGNAVRLGDYFDGDRPVLITLNYYRCPTLCNLQLNSLTRTLEGFAESPDWAPGEQYRIVTVSIDPREGPELAAKKRATHLEALGVIRASRLELPDRRRLAGAHARGFAGHRLRLRRRARSVRPPVGADVRLARGQGRALPLRARVSAERRQVRADGGGRGPRRQPGRQVDPVLLPLRRVVGGVRTICDGHHAPRWRRDDPHRRYPHGVHLAARASSPAERQLFTAAVNRSHTRPDARRHERDRYLHSARETRHPEDVGLPVGAAADRVEPRGALDGLYIFLTYVCGVSFVLVIGAMVYFMWKYRKRGDDDKTSPLTHNGRLEFAWSAVPAVFLMVFFIWGELDFIKLSSPPPDALDIRITGQKWYWTIEYPGRPVASTVEVLDGEIAPLLIVPLGQPVRLLMTSKDVLHSFYIPAFRVKKDIVPGRYTSVWFTPIIEGVFPVFCTEYCGDEHSSMLAVVKVVPARGVRGRGGRRDHARAGRGRDARGVRREGLQVVRLQLLPQHRRAP